MPRRFTVTEKWKDCWFRGLKPSAKLLFLYLCDECDVAGFWEIDWGQAAFSTKLNLRTLQGAYEALMGKVESDGKYIRVVNFLKHQRNWPLNPENRVHNSILQSLNSHKNFQNKPLTSPITKGASPSTRGYGKGKGKGKGKKFIPPILSEVQKYISEKGYDVDAKKFMEYFTESGWVDSKGNSVRNWKQKVITWSGRDGREKETPKVCVIDRNPASKYQIDKNGKKVYLCDSCREVFKKTKFAAWADLPVNKLEKIILEQKAR